MLDTFDERMKELDALVDSCRGGEPFASSVVRDASNRSKRDWPWWGVSLERTSTDGANHRRLTATITLDCDQDGSPGAFRADWQARMWRHASTDDCRERGRWPLVWANPTMTQIGSAMTALLAAAEAAMAKRCPG